MTDVKQCGNCKHWLRGMEGYGICRYDLSAFKLPIWVEDEFKVCRVTHRTQGGKCYCFERKVGKKKA